MPLPDDRPPVSLRAQIEEVERELAMRANVYPKWVAGRKMTQAAADEHIRRMRAVLKTLRDLQGGTMS